MQIEVVIDKTLPKPRAVVYCPAMTPELSRLVAALQGEQPQVISGFKDQKLEVIDPSNIERVYSQDRKVFAVAGGDRYLLRQRLYEMEQRLDPARFVRISNSEILNLSRVKSFDLSFTGTICVELMSGEVTYVSRRYVSRIKSILGV